MGAKGCGAAHLRPDAPADPPTEGAGVAEELGCQGRSREAGPKAALTANLLRKPCDEAAPLARCIQSALAIGIVPVAPTQLC